MEWPGALPDAPLWYPSGPVLTPRNQQGCRPSASPPPPTPSSRYCMYLPKHPQIPRYPQRVERPPNSLILATDNIGITTRHEHKHKLFQSLLAPPDTRIKAHRLKGYAYSTHKKVERKSWPDPTAELSTSTYVSSCQLQNATR